MERVIRVECNDIKCKHQWDMKADVDRIVRNRLMGLEYCPKCFRFDSPYIIPSKNPKDIHSKPYVVSKFQKDINR